MFDSVPTGPGIFREVSDFVAIQFRVGEINQTALCRSAVPPLPVSVLAGRGSESGGRVDAHVFDGAHHESGGAAGVADEGTGYGFVGLSRSNTGLMA